MSKDKSNEKLSNFVRGFRREATDFSLFSKRHSTSFPEQSTSQQTSSSPQKFQRSSAFFQRNKNKGEPVLTEYIKRNSLSKNDRKNTINENIQEFRRIRREKTESVISIVRNQSPLSFQVKIVREQNIRSYLFRSKSMSGMLNYQIKKSCAHSQFTVYH